MFNTQKNYNEIYFRESRKNFHISDGLRQQLFLENVYKLCPNCGAYNPILAKGCDNCLYQFKGGFRGRQQKDSG